MPPVLAAVLLLLAGVCFILAALVGSVGSFQFGWAGMVLLTVVLIPVVRAAVGPLS